MIVNMAVMDWIIPPFTTFGTGFMCFFFGCFTDDHQLPKTKTKEMGGIPKTIPRWMPSHGPQRYTIARNRYPVRFRVLLHRVLFDTMASFRLPGNEGFFTCNKLKSNAQMQTTCKC